MRNLGLSLRAVPRKGTRIDGKNHDAEGGANT